MQVVMVITFTTQTGNAYSRVVNDSMLVVIVIRVPIQIVVDTER